MLNMGMEKSKNNAEKIKNEMETLPEGL